MTELNDYGLPLRRRDRASKDIEGKDPAELAAEELAQRELAKHNLLAFIIRENTDYLVAEFHRYLTAKLEAFSEAVARGESPRLIIEMPPRSGKSEIVSRNFPAWHLGRYPDHEFIACSYGSDLAKDFSRKVRASLMDEGYQMLFPDVELDPTSRAADRWNIDGHAGGYVAAGVGGPITGRGMHVGVIDDYFKNWKDSDSTAAREDLWNWYESTFKSRLAPGAGIIIMATRWNIDDLIGRVITDEGLVQDGGKWERVSLKAIADTEDDCYLPDGHKFREVGGALHPERYDEEFYKQFQRNKRVWNALYQQNPILESGGMFPSSRFALYRIDMRPRLEELFIVSAWDFAVGQNQENDFTVGAVGGIDRDFRMWGLDQERGKWDPTQIIDAIVRVYKNWGPDEWGFEHGQIEMSLRPFLARRLIQEKIYDMDIDESLLKTGKQDKVARAKPLEGFVKLGQFLYPEESDWFPVFRNEAKFFPRGGSTVHDDTVDAWAWLAFMAERFIERGEHPKAPGPQKRYGQTLADKIRQIANGQRYGRDRRSPMSA